MLGRTHLLAASTIGILVLKTTTITSPPFFFLALLFGSIFPDIDSQTSILGRKISFLSFFLRHRGFFHSPLLLILLSIVFYSIHPSIALGFALGFLSHIFLDIITKEGIYFTFIGRLRGPIQVGGFYEHLLSVLFIVLIFSSFLS